MKILLVDTSYPINSRNLRIVNSLNDTFGKSNVKFATWLRDNREIAKEDRDNYIFKLYSPLGDASGKLKNLYKFKKFIKKSLNSYKPDIIIASHWDSLFICALSMNKNQTLIYENLDMPSGGTKKMKLLRFIEKIGLKKTSAIIFASRFFIPYYENFRGKKILLENLISKEIDTQINHSNENNDNLIITFNGALRYPLMFKNLFQAVGNLEGIQIHLYGYGIGEQAEQIYEAAKPFNNIHFFGSYNYKEIPIIYSKTDIIWAVYPSKNFNVKAAISNKFHESVFFEVPGIFAKDTNLGKMVEEMEIGFQVDGYNVQEIKNLILKLRENKRANISIIRKKMKLLKSQNSLLWEDSISYLTEYLKTL